MNDIKRVLNIKWEDSEKRGHVVGILAEDSGTFYMIAKKSSQSQTEGSEIVAVIPGFNPGEVYTSNRIFDFFERRLVNKKSQDPFDDLMENGGRSMVDSFYLEEVPGTEIDKRLKVIKEMYEKQETLKKLRTGIGYKRISGNIK